MVPPPKEFESESDGEVCPSKHSPTHTHTFDFLSRWFLNACVSVGDTVLLIGVRFGGIRRAHPNEGSLPDLHPTRLATAIPV